MNLTEKQKNFIREYLIDLNATQAAIRAGYSEKTAHVIGHQNLRKLKIEEEIQKRRKKLIDKTELNQERILDELKNISFSDLGELFKGEETLIRPDQLPEETRRAIAALEIIDTFDKDGNKTTRLKYKFWDKMGAIKQIREILGIGPDKLILDAGGNMMSLVSAHLDKKEKREG